MFLALQTLSAGPPARTGDASWSRSDRGRGCRRQMLRGSIDTEIPELSRRRRTAAPSGNGIEVPTTRCARIAPAFLDESGRWMTGGPTGMPMRIRRHEGSGFRVRPGDGRALRRRGAALPGGRLKCVPPTPPVSMIVLVRKECPWSSSSCSGGTNWIFTAASPSKSIAFAIMLTCPFSSKCGQLEQSSRIRTRNRSATVITRDGYAERPLSPSTRCKSLESP